MKTRIYATPAVKGLNIKMFGIRFNKIVSSSFHPLEVVGRGSEPQLQVGEII